jgi:hypothetical protein
MARVTTVALAMLLMVVTGAAGADEKGTGKSKPVGVWKRTAGENSITFTIKGDTLQVVVKAGGNTMEIDADYGVSKDDVLFARINKSKKEGEGPSEGDLFSFRFKVENDRLTVSELKTAHDSAEAKELVQGEYQRQKGKAE